jgi:DNA-binding response OmpR family regulator
VTPLPSSHAPRVLLVNDDVSVSDMFCRSLRLDGFEVWGALSVREGVVLAEKHRPHTVIVDLRMPLPSAVDVARTLRALDGLAHVPIAVVTSDYYLSDEQAERLRALGATVRFKPLWLNELVEVARELVHASVAL